MRNGSSVGICTRCVHAFARLGADLRALSVLSSKISASELSRKLIDNALLVGLVLLYLNIGGAKKGDQKTDDARRGRGRNLFFNRIFLIRQILSDKEKMPLKI